MAQEIERKFIVPLEFHSLFLERKGGTEVTQAYLSSSPGQTIRIRIAKTEDLEVAKMTVKGRSSNGGLVRSEWEWPMPVESAKNIIEELDPPRFNKVRHVVSHGENSWEVDVLRVNEIAGRPPVMWKYLVVAEFEGTSLEKVQNVILPPWVGRDVTGDSIFSMVNLTTEALRDLAWRKAYL